MVIRFLFLLFVRPSELQSFAVIDFSTSGRAKDYLNVLFMVMQSHGMPLPYNVNLSRALEKVYYSTRESREPCYPDSPDGVSRPLVSDANQNIVFISCSLELFILQVYAAFKVSLEKAKNFFWYDTSREFRNNNVWFKTRCTSPRGAVSECLLLPQFVTEDDEIGVMLPANVYGPTHNVLVGNTELLVRLMVVVHVLDIRSDFTVDPFDFFLESGKQLNPCLLYKRLHFESCSEFCQFQRSFSMNCQMDTTPFKMDCAVE